MIAHEEGSCVIRLTLDQERILMDEIGDLPSKTTGRILRRIHRELRAHDDMRKASEDASRRERKKSTS